LTGVKKNMRYDTPAEREMQESVLTRFGVFLRKSHGAASRIHEGKSFGDKIYRLSKS
jgi:hypothetical protein